MNTQHVYNIFHLCGPRNRRRDILALTSPSGRCLTPPTVKTIRNQSHRNAAVLKSEYVVKNKSGTQKKRPDKRREDLIYYGLLFITNVIIN